MLLRGNHGGWNDISTESYHAQGGKAVGVLDLRDCGHCSLQRKALIDLTKVLSLKAFGSFYRQLRGSTSII